MTSAVTYEVGDVLVFGAEGFARVVAVGEKTVLGRSATFLDLYVIDSSMRVSVPVERAVERGLRPIASPDVIEAALDAIQASRWQALPWNRDGRPVKERFASGELEAVLDTIGSILEIAAVKKLNDAQRTLLDRARRQLVLEVAAAFEIDETEAGERVDSAFAVRA